MKHYIGSVSTDGVGLVCTLTGPGMPQHANKIHIHKSEYSGHEVEAIERLLEAAYQAGMKAKAEQIRLALGIDNTPWGIRIDGR